jgi:DNA-binding response OmpR family regulator
VRLLLIEDDPKLAEHTAEYLRGHEAQVEIAGDGETGLGRAIAGEFNLVLLDVMLPGIDGFEVCKRLRKEATLPVIMLTARDDEVDRVVGLEIGADDYVPKPFSPRELLARIRAVLRRGRGEVETPEQVNVAALFVDRARRQVALGGSPIELTAYQFDVLWALAESAERVLTREKLYSRVRELRGEPPAEFDPSVDRSIDVHVSNVRQALAKSGPDGEGLIQTVRGVGYVLGRDPL